MIKNLHGNLKVLNFIFEMRRYYPLNFCMIFDS